MWSLILCFRPDLSGPSFLILRRVEKSGTLAAASGALFFLLSMVSKTKLKQKHKSDTLEPRLILVITPTFFVQAKCPYNFFHRKATLTRPLRYDQWLHMWNPNLYDSLWFLSVNTVLEPVMFVSRSSVINIVCTGHFNKELLRSKTVIYL